MEEKNKQNKKKSAVDCGLHNIDPTRGRGPGSSGCTHLSRAFVHLPGYADNALEFLVGSAREQRGRLCLLAKTLAVASG